MVDNVPFVARIELGVTGSLNLPTEPLPFADKAHTNSHSALPLRCQVCQSLSGKVAVAMAMRRTTMVTDIRKHYSCFCLVRSLLSLVPLVND